jgi:nicotinate phosphoribosyltransferase
MRKRALASGACLRQSLTAINASSGYPVEISGPLRAPAKQLDADAGAQSFQTRTS